MIPDQLVIPKGFKILYDSRDSNVGFNYLVNKMLNFRIIQNDENELETYN